MELLTYQVVCILCLVIIVCQYTELKKIEDARKKHTRLPR